MKISSIQKSRLKTASHIKTMQRMVQRASELTPADMSNHAGAQEALALLKTAVEKEERDYKKEQGSELSAQIAEADAQRDRAYMTIKQVAELFAKGCGSAEQIEGAKKLMSIISKYKLEVKTQMDEESGIIDQIVADVRALADSTALLNSLGLGTAFLQLTSSNEYVDELLDQRDDERAPQEKGLTKADRQQTDAAYDLWVDYVNALLLLHPNQTLIDFAQAWNAVLNRIRTQVLKQSVSSSDSTVDVDLDSETPQPDEDEDLSKD